MFAKRKPLPKRDRPARNRAFKTHIEAPLDWSNIDEIEAAQDVIEFTFEAEHFKVFDDILQIELSWAQKNELNEIATSYRHQNRQGAPSKDTAAADLRKLAKISNRLARSHFMEQSSLNTAESLIYNLNGLSFYRLTNELRSQSQLAADVDLGSLIYGPRRDWSLIAEASASAARYTNQGCYRGANAKLCVQHLADFFKAHTGKRLSYSAKRNPDFTTFAGSQAARFVEYFFRLVDDALPPQTSGNNLDELLTYRRKKLRNTT